jgi:hypothetical protein
MTAYTGRPAIWEPIDCHVYFDVPGGVSGRIRIPARDASTALATFQSKWGDIAELATMRRDSGDLQNGEVVLNIATFL